MKTCKTPEEYIKAISPAVQRCCKRYGYLPSVLIAQSFIENGAGIPDWWDNPQIALLMKYNNMVGIKSDLLSKSWADKTVWPGESLTKETPEYYDGKKVIITDQFRKYDDIEQSFADFLLFMKYGANTVGGKPKYGDSVLSMKDPEKLITKVNKLGYATSQEYAKHVMKVIEEHDLTNYDDLTGVEPTKYTPGYREKKEPKTVKITKKTVTDITARNKSQIPASRGNNPIKFIVIHYLGVPNADNPDLYGGGYGGHYNIERNGKIYKAANPKTAVVWQCGGDRQGSGGGTFFGICTNYNSIGIECGVCYTETGVKDPDESSDKWYFTEETQESLIWLVAKLMKEYGIGIDHVIRHYDVTGKICPNPYVRNNHTRTSWTWTEFKSNLKQYMENGTITIPDGSAPKPTPAPEPEPAPKTTLLKKGSKGAAVKTMQSMLITCGYSCGATGADGQFGANTEKALKAFQKKEKLTIDGIYGPASKKALQAAYDARRAKETTDKPVKPIKRIMACETIATAVGMVADTAREEKWEYGDSRSKIPCADGLISCDRLIARALYAMGFHDQREGGETCGTLDAYLTARGWTKVTKKSQIQPGAVVAVRNSDQKFINHVFFVVSYNKDTDLCTKYDAGSNDRIRAKQPFKDAKLVEWLNRTFVCAWNCPTWLSSVTPGKYVSDGVDYGAVFNSGYYRRMYPDLQEAFGTDKKKLFEHFIKTGMKEGRQAYAGFNPYAYRDRYPDLKKAFGHDLPKYYRHFCEYGQAEGRIGV